jgi:hypothetical protein
MELMRVKNDPRDRKTELLAGGTHHRYADRIARWDTTDTDENHH